MGRSRNNSLGTSGWRVGRFSKAGMPNSSRKKEGLVGATPSSSPPLFRVVPGAASPSRHQKPAAGLIFSFLFVNYIP